MRRCKVRAYGSHNLRCECCESCKKTLLLYNRARSTHVSRVRVIVNKYATRSGRSAHDRKTDCTALRRYTLHPESRPPHLQPYTSVHQNCKPATCRLVTCRRLVDVMSLCRTCTTVMSPSQCAKYLPSLWSPANRMPRCTPHHSRYCTARAASTAERTSTSARPRPHTFWAAVGSSALPLDFGRSVI